MAPLVVLKEDSEDYMGVIDSVPPDLMAVFEALPHKPADVGMPFRLPQSLSSHPASGLTKAGHS